MFIECFFEAQASITEDFKSSIDEREWWIDIDDGKTAHQVSHEKYFMEKLIDAGFKLDEKVLFFGDIANVIANEGDELNEKNKYSFSELIKKVTVSVT